MNKFKAYLVGVYDFEDKDIFKISLIKNEDMIKQVDFDNITWAIIKFIDERIEPEFRRTHITTELNGFLFEIHYDRIFVYKYIGVASEKEEMLKLMKQYGHIMAIVLQYSPDKHVKYFTYGIKLDNITIKEIMEQWMGWDI